jgi:hypothetical protein
VVNAVAVIHNVDPTDLDIETLVGGELRQDANTELMLFDPSEVVSYLSKRFTFEPGDCVAFGSPANPGLVEPGERVEITYEGVGTLSNRSVRTGASNRREAIPFVAGTDFPRHCGRVGSGRRITAATSGRDRR